MKKTLANGMAVSHTFDAAGRETLLENRAADGTALAVYTATYDAVANRLTAVELDGVRVTYGYDEIYQLVNEQRSGANAYYTTYAYDGAGNRTLKNDSGQLTTYALNAASELVLVTPPSGQPTTISWDANGNMAEENAAGSRTTYAWDDENRMTRVALPDGSLETHAYSADGHRQRKDVGATIQRFVWDEENVLLELDTSLVTQVRYTDFPGFWGGLASQRRSVTSNFYGFDLQDSSRVLVSVGGVITDNYTFKAFGEELAASGTTANALRFAGAVGYQRDTEARVYVRARQLAVTRGTWLCTDPLGAGPAGAQFYVYANNNPARYLDPAGMFPTVPDKCRCLNYDLGVLNDCIDKLCTALRTDKSGTVYEAIRKCAKRYRVNPGCLAGWCAKGKNIQCYITPGTSFCARDTGWLCHSECGKNIEKTVLVPAGCAQDDCVPGSPNPTGRIVYCCYWQQLFLRERPDGRIPHECEEVGSNWLHELGHMCSGRCKDTGRTEQELVRFAECVLKAIGCTKR